MSDADDSDNFLPLPGSPANSGTHNDSDSGSGSDHEPRRKVLRQMSIDDDDNSPNLPLEALDEIPYPIDSNKDDDAEQEHDLEEEHEHELEHDIDIDIDIPLPPDSSDSKYSPSQATAEDASPVSVSETNQKKTVAVLGRAQAKKRLQAFSAAKLAATSTTSGSGGKKSSPLKGVSVFSGRSSDSSKQPPLAIASIKEEETKMKEILAMNSLLSEKLKTVHAITTSVPGPSPATAIVKPLNSEFRNSESHMLDKDKAADLLGKKSDDHMTSFTVKKQIKNIRRKRAMSSSSNSSRSASRSKSPVVKRRGDRDRDRDRRSRSRDKERIKERDRERDRDRGRDLDRDRDRDRMERDRNRDREREKENVKRSKRSRSRSKNRDIIDRKRSKSPKSSKDKQRIKSRSKSRERRGRRSRSRDRKIRSISRSHSRGRDRDIKEKVREKRKDSSVIRETKKSLSPPIQSRTIDKKSLSKSPSPDIIISSKKLSRSRSHSREKEPSKSRKSRSRSKSVERAVVVEKRKQSRSRSREREGRSSRRRKSPKHKKDKERDREREKEREKAKQLERERREKEEKKEAERRREREKIEAYERELDKVRTTRMPTDWIEYKKFKYSTDHVQDVWKLVLSKEEPKSIKARSRSRSSSRSPARGGTEAEAPLSLGKSLTQHPILIKTTPIDLKSNLKRDYPLCLCKLTKHKPPVDYGPNPLSYAGYFKSREEVFNEEDAEMVKDMTTIVESVTSSVPTGDLPKSQEWFAEHEQIFCPTEGSKGIVISHLYSDDDMDDLSLPAVASKLAAVVKPEKQKKVVSETEEPERPEPPPARSSTQPKPATTIDEEYSSESSQSQDSVPSPLLKKRYESDLLLPTPTTSSSSHGPLELEISGERQPEEETRRRPLSPRSDEIEEEIIEELHPEPAQQPEPLHPIVIPTKESKSQKSSSKSKNKKEKKKKKKKDSKRRSRHESKGSSKKKASTKSEDDDESDVKGKSSDDSASASDDESGKSKSKKKKSKLMEEETVPVPSSKSKLLKSSSSSVGVVVPEDKKKGKSSSSVSEKSKRKSSKKSRKGKYQSETDDSKRSSSSNSSEDRGSSSSTDSESNEKEKRKKKKKSYKKKKDKDRSRREKDDDTSDGEPGDKDKRGGPPGGSSSGGRGGSSRNQRRDRDYDDHRGDRDGHHHKSSKDPDRDRSDRKKSSKHKKRERGNPQQRESSAEDENESSSYSSSSSTTGSSSSQSSSLSTRESFVEEMTRDPDIQFALKGMHVEQGEGDCNNDGQRMIAKLLLDIENDDFNINSSGGGGRKPAGGDEKYDPFTDTDMLEDAVQIAINRQVNNNNKNTTNRINKKTDPQKDESSSSSMSSSSSTESSDTGAQDLLKTFENDTLLDFVLKNNNDLSTENLLASISGPDATTTAAADNSISLLKDEKKVEQVVTLVPCALASPVIKAKLEVVEYQKQKPVLAVQKQHNLECLPQSEEVPGAELSLNSTEEKPNSKVVDGDHDHEKSGSLLQRESHHHPRLGRIPCKRSYSSSRSRSRSRSVSRSRSRSISPNYRRHNSRSRYSDSYEHDRWSHQQSYDRDRRNDRYRSEDRRSHYVNDEPHNYRSRDVVRGDKEIIHYDRLPRYERHRRPHSRDSPLRREYSSSSRHERERDRDRERSPEEYPRYPPHRRSRFDRGIEREYSDKDRLEFEKHFRDGCLDGNGRHSPDLSEKPITTICSLVGAEGAAQHQQSSPPLRLNVADSTISDSELPDNSVLAYNNSIGGHEGNRANPSNLKEIIPDPELNNSQIRPDNISSGGYASSPKRLSLDERLEMEMGIKLQDEPSSLQHGFPHHRPNYSVHMGKQQKFPAVPSHGPGQSAARSSMLGPNWQNSSTPPTHVQGSYEAPPQPRQSQAIQLGDMLQVLPGEMPERAFTVTKENCKLNPLTVLQYATQVIRKEGDQVDPSKCVTIRVPVVPFKVPVFKHPEPQVYHESQPAQDEEELNRKQRRMELKKIAEKKKLREKKKLMLKKKILEKKMAKKLRAQALKAAENKGDAKKEESNSSLTSISEKNEGNELEAADPEELKLLKEALTEVPTDVSEDGVESCISEDLPSSEIIPPPDVVSKEEDEIPKPDDMKEADENEDETGGKGEPASPPQPSSESFPASACIDFIQPKGILVVAGFRERILSDKPSKAVKFMDGIHPGYGSSRSEGEEIHSPPPVPQNKVLVKKKEKRKKIKIKLKNDEKKTKSKLEVLGEIDPNTPKRPPPPPPKTPYPYCPLGILYQFNPPYAVLYAQAVVEHEFEVTYTPSMEAPRDFSGQCDAVIVDDLLSVQNEKPKQSIPTITTPMPIHEPGVGADTASSWLVSQTSSERHRRKKHRDREYSKSIDSEVKSADACSESRSSSRSSSSSHHSSHKSAHAQPIPTIVGVMPNSASKTRDFHPTKDIELAENDEGNPDVPMNIPTDTKPTGESSNSKNLISLSSHREEHNIDLYPIQGGHEIQQPYDEERKFDVCRTGSKRDENHRKESNKYHEDHRISRKHVDDHRHKHYENHRSDRHKHGIENHRSDSYNNKHVENHRSENHHKNSDHKRQGKHGKGKRLEHDSGFKEASQGKEANPNLIPISPSPTTLSRTTIPLPTNSPAMLLDGSSSISESPKQKNDSPVSETSVVSPDPGIIRIQPKLEDEDQKFSPIPIVSRAKPQIKIKMSTISFASTPTSLSLPAVKLMNTSASPVPVPVPKPQISPVIPTRISTPPTAIISPVSIHQMDTTGPPPTHVPPPVHINVPVLHKSTFDYYCQANTGSNLPHTFPVAAPVPPPTSVHIIPGGLPSGIDLTRPPPLTPSFNPIGDVSHVNYSPRKFTPTAPTRIPGNSNLTIVKCTNDLMTLVPPREIITDVDNLGEIPSTPPPPGTSP